MILNMERNLSIASIESRKGQIVNDDPSINNRFLGLTVDPLGPGIEKNYSIAIAEFLKSEDPSRRDSLYVVLPITIIYVVILITGIVGNVSTCVVIARNRSMHTATNYYLFSLAISDLLLLISGLPPEMYFIWSQFPYVFGEVFCVIQSFAAETSANATVLTITAFTVERYVAICHPFMSHTMSKLTRAIKFVVVIWLLALCLAIPQAIQFGVVYNYNNGTAIMDSASCTVKWDLIDHAFEISTMLFFVLPMTIITVLYILIGIKLRRSRLLTALKKTSISSNFNHWDSRRGKRAAQRNVIRMLVAVVVAFFICWAPFHAQRLLAVYAQGSSEEKHPDLVIVYKTLTYVSGVFYYLSTIVNPLLYNIMSNKFREAFKAMLSQHCGRRKIPQKSSIHRPTYSALSRYPDRRVDNRQSASVSTSDDTQKLAPVNSPVNEVINQSQNVVPARSNQQLVPSRSDYPPTRTKNSNTQNNDRSRSKGSSNCSQVTLMTTIGKAFGEGNNNVTFSVTRNDTCGNDRLLRKQRSQKSVTLGILAERLRFGTKGFFVSQTKVTRPKVRPEAVSAPPKLQSHLSTESANTISNSSLQDLDETEFTGSELARYMGELNFDLVT